MSTLIRQTCFVHRQREAAARCPECARFFCRECVTEHEGRVLCVGCLARVNERAGESRLRLGWLWRAGQVTAALFLAWIFFYWLGGLLLRIPPDVHEGIYWEFQRDWTQ
jgi:hypothetical protein